MWQAGWIILAVVLFNWVLPFYLSWAYVWWAHFYADFIHAGFRAGPHICFAVTNQGLKRWHINWWNDLGGVGLFLVMVVRLKVGDTDEASSQRALFHLSTHSWQWVILGMMYPVAYSAHYYFIKWLQHDKDPYLDCWAERMARRRACQQIDIPRDQWSAQTDGRWNWW